MKERYFGIDVVFDKQEVDEIVATHIREKKTGYVVSLSMNNAVITYNDPVHRDIVNGSIVTFSDSSWFPIMVNHVYHTHYKNYCSADMFEEIVKSRKYRQFFLGNTQRVLDGLRSKLSEWDPAIMDMGFQELPYRTVEEFDYKGIARMLNEYKADIIWVSLGAPKQEQFMARLLPYLEQGVMFGWGALFNFYSGVDDAPKRAPKWMQRLKLEWFFRLLNDKNVRKKDKKFGTYSTPLKMIREEKRMLRSQKGQKKS